MYSRKAQTVKIYLKDRGNHMFIRAVLTMHNSWLEVRGKQVAREYSPGSGSWDPPKKGIIADAKADHIYPEAAIQFIEINDEKVDLRHFKKEK